MYHRRIIADFTFSRRRIAKNKDGEREERGVGETREEKHEIYQKLEGV